MTKYRATIPGTENVLIGMGWEPHRPDGGLGAAFIGRLLVGPFPNVSGTFQAIDLYGGWKVEKLVELPTKRNAIIKFVNKFENTVYAWHSAVDPHYTWEYADEGLIDDSDLLLEINSGKGDFEVIFEGTED